MNVATNSLVAEITELLTTKVNVAVPSPETDLLQAGILDSLGVVELILQLELQYRIPVKLEDLELDNFRSAVTIAAFVADALERPGGVDR
jgi:acyl carrier protein